MSKNVAISAGTHEVACDARCARCARRTPLGSPSLHARGEEQVFVLPIHVELARLFLERMLDARAFPGACLLHSQAIHGQPVPP